MILKYFLVFVKIRNIPLFTSIIIIGFFQFELFCLYFVRCDRYDSRMLSFHLCVNRIIALNEITDTFGNIREQLTGIVFPGKGTV